MTAREIGSLRLCADLEVQLNSKDMNEFYPIPDIETIFHNLHETSDFRTIDLSDAYYQTELDEDGKEIRAISTSQGVFRMGRLFKCLTKLLPVV